MKELDLLNSYFVQFADLVDLHRKLELGSNPHIPPVFSERLVRAILSYGKWHNRDFDAEHNGKGVEIKATGSLSGTTSINVDSIKSEHFSHLIWVYFDFDNRTAVLQRIEKQDLLEDEKLIGSVKDRANVSLSRFPRNTLKEHKFQVRS
ncbi:hypothetical protein QPP83_004521 [Vibrio parahaemolyticus]|nr:hypothetical protein [Vibrio parahaemolyticus]